MEADPKDKEVSDVLLHFGVTEAKKGGVFYRHLIGVMRIIARMSPVPREDLYGYIKFDVGINEERAKEYLRALKVKGIINDRFDDVVWIGCNGVKK